MRPASLQAARQVSTDGDERLPRRPRAIARHRRTRSPRGSMRPNAGARSCSHLLVAEVVKDFVDTSDAEPQMRAPPCCRVAACCLKVSHRKLDPGPPPAKIAHN